MVSGGADNSAFPILPERMACWCSKWAGYIESKKEPKMVLTTNDTVTDQSC